MNKNNTSKSLVFCFIGLFLCLALFIGTTFAVFSKTIISGKNNITAGFDVSLKVFDKNPIKETSNNTGSDFTNNSILFDNISLSAGDNTGIKFIKVHNGTNKSINVTVKLTDCTCYSITGEPVWFMCFEELDESGSFNSNYTTNFPDSSTYNLVEQKSIESGKDYVFAVGLELSKTNSTIGDTASFKVSVLSEQEQA